MSIFMIHFCWFLIFFLLAIFFFILSMYISLSSESMHVSFDLFSSWFLKMSMHVSFDLFSSWFSFVVCLISSVVMVYSYFYMMPYSKVNYFIWLTSFFVFSMLVVINMSNLFFVMLGWDGLGLVSFFLIVFYQNFSSIYSGLFTVLMNRLGDCLFIISISLLFVNYPSFWDSVSFSSSSIMGFVTLSSMMVAFLTKSAIYPFSPWLPLAMAAPTPISALVHSSTLVTAGLYLCMRFSFFLYSSIELMNLMLVLSVFTSFYAGMNSVFEADMKKLIALSTLSHLGFIGMAFSCGLLYLSFFHLLTHALFKSVLFMAMGDVMTNLSHSQDIRFLSSGLVLTPSSFYTMMVSILNLLGMPSMSGFYSKDLVLESLSFSSSSFFIVVMVYMNLFFTYYYTYKIFYYSFSSVKLSPFFMKSAPSFIHSLLLLMISVVSIVFGWFWISMVNFWVVHVVVPYSLKFLPLVLSFFFFVYLLVFLNLFSVKSSSVYFYFSSMMFLSCIMMTVSSNLYVKTSFYMTKTLEYGILDKFFNQSFCSVIGAVSVSVLKSISLSSLYMVVFSAFLCFVLWGF